MIFVGIATCQDAERLYCTAVSCHKPTKLFTRVFVNNNNTSDIKTVINASCYRIIEKLFIYNIIKAPPEIQLVSGLPLKRSFIFPCTCAPDSDIVNEATRYLYDRINKKRRLTTQSRH
jgi:hypothetical protein